MEYIKYLTYAQASCDETINHLDTIIELYPLINEFREMEKDYQILCKQINTYIKYVEKSWR